MEVAHPSSPKTLEPQLEKSEPGDPASVSADHSSVPLPAQPASSSTVADSSAQENANPQTNPDPNPNANPPVLAPPPPSIPSFTPSFRPVGVPPVPQYTPISNPNLHNPSFQTSMVQNPSIQPPGVTAPGTYMPPGASGAGSVMVSAPPRPPGIYQVSPGQPPAAAPRPYGQIPNGYMTSSPAGPNMFPPPGIPRYPSSYPLMVRPGFPPRAPAPMGLIPRPPMPGMRGYPLIVPPVVRPVAPVVAPTEKPQTTVYVGKIGPSVENEFMLSVLRLCGPVKSWKRAQDPTDGTPRGFGFCEFESAEGVLRALRLLSKLNIDGQQLVLNVNQATREYLERFVEKKTEEKNKENEIQGAAEKEDGSTPGVEKDSSKPIVVDLKKDADDTGEYEKQDKTQKFGLVTDEDRNADGDALEKLTNLIEERLKTRPLPPPPPLQPIADGSTKSNSEVPSKSRDGDSDVDIMRSDAADDKHDEETSEHKASTEPDKPEMSSSDRGRLRERSRERDSERGRERDKERDAKRDKERELERYERERERERIRRERDREMKLREVERLYKDRVKEWEAREREKEYQRQYEKDREKERERERRREIMDQEDESDDDDTRKRRRRSSVIEEKCRKRQREKEEDIADGIKEEEEIAEAKKRTIEEQKQRDSSEPLPSQVSNKNEETVMQEEISTKGTENPVEFAHESNLVVGHNTGDEVHRNDSGDELNMVSVSDIKQNSNVSSWKLGFGLSGSGKRAAVPSVFREEDDGDVNEKKMRPLVPIDYTTEELEGLQATASETPPHLVAAAEFAKRISNSNSKDDKSDMEKERSRRSNDRTSQRDRYRNGEESNRTRDENRERMHDKFSDSTKDREEKIKTAENKKLLDAKQLIDMIPKTKEELFSYEINWAVYDKHDLHERMRPWISKKITEFLGEEEATLVDYIVSSTKDHVRASQMLDLLESILDDEAEMFVLKMWRMLIFEIKKVETGLSLKTRT